ALEAGQLQIGLLARVPFEAESVEVAGRRDSLQDGRQAVLLLGAELVDGVAREDAEGCVARSGSCGPGQDLESIALEAPGAIGLGQADRRQQKLRPPGLVRPDQSSKPERLVRVPDIDRLPVDAPP